MTQQQYDALLSEFDDSPSRLKGWVYRTVASAKNGQRVSQEQLAAAKLVVRFIEREQSIDMVQATVHPSGDRYGTLGYDARLVAVHTVRGGAHGARPVRYVAGLHAAVAARLKEAGFKPRPSELPPMGSLASLPLQRGHLRR